MTPTLHPRLLNGRGGDPAVYVEAMHAPGAVLFDCGDLSTLSAGHLLRVELLCVSHTHMDHWSDLDRLLRLLVGREKRLQVVGPPGLAARLHHRLASYTWNLVDRIPQDLVLEVTELAAEAPHPGPTPGPHPGPTPCPRTRLRLRTGFVAEAMEPVPPEADGTVLRMGQLRLRAGLLDHGIPVAGFCLQEEVHLNVWRSRLEQAGLPPGPWLAALKGAVAAGLPDGHVLATPAGERRLGELRGLVQATPGQRVAYLTDFADTPANRAVALRLADRADTLLIEATFMAEDTAAAVDRLHLTTKAAGAIARQAGARRVEPFHMSPRYTGREEAWLAEVMTAFGAGAPPGEGARSGPGSPP